MYYYYNMLERISEFHAANCCRVCSPCGLVLCQVEPGGSRRFPEVPGGSQRFPEVPEGSCFGVYADLAVKVKTMIGET